MSISPVSSSSYQRLENYKSQLQKSGGEHVSELGTTKDLPAGFLKEQFASSDNGPESQLNGSKIWEELSAAGIEDFNFRLVNTEPVPGTTLNSNIEATQRTASVTAGAEPTASAEELHAIDTMLSDPDVQTMMAAQTFEIPEATTPQEIALVERNGEQRYAQMQRYDAAMSQVHTDYQSALASAYRGNGSSGGGNGGRNDDASYTTGRYWDVTHGNGPNGTTTSTFNRARFDSDYRQRDTPSARLFETVSGRFNIIANEGPNGGNAGNIRIIYSNSEFALLNLNDLPPLHDQNAITMVEGLGWVTDTDNVIRDSGGLLGGIGDAFSSAGDFLSDTVNSFGGALNDGLDFINEEIVSPVISAIPVIGEPINEHLVQPAFGLAELGVNLTVNTIDYAIDTTTNLGVGATDVLSHLASGDISGAISSVGQTIATLGTDAVGFVIESAALTLKTAALTYNALFSASEVRGLLPAEREYLETIFGNSLDYNDIEIQIGGGLESAVGFGDQAHAIGDTIYMPESNFQNGLLTAKGLDLLAHEATHVWQFQNDGANYIEEAVFSYGEDALNGTDDAYDFTTAIVNMTPWDEMTPDQQAEIAMVIGEALEKNTDGVLAIEELTDAIGAHREFGPEIEEISQSQLAYLENIHQLLLSGEV